MKILVVLGDEECTQGTDALVIKKARQLASVHGASLELFRIRYERSLELSLFTKPDVLANARQGILAGEEEQLRSITEALRAQGLSANYEVCWDHPEAEAIVRKLLTDQCDLVFKTAGADRYLVGLLSNTDWQLLRESPKPVWFVKGEHWPDSGILAAIEGIVAGEDSAESALDYAVFNQAQDLAESFAAPLNVVHAFQVPMGVPTYAGYAPAFGDAGVSPATLEALSESDRDIHREVAEQHGQAIERFAEHFGFPRDHIVIREGAPEVVISDEAHKKNAGLVVMGAGEASLLDRLFRKVSAEPTLAEAECDILFVKANNASEIAQAAQEPEEARQGVSQDSSQLGKILAEPASHFESPEHVLKDERFDDYSKLRILRSWISGLNPRSTREGTKKAPLLEETRRALRRLRGRTEEEAPPD